MLWIWRYFWWSRIWNIFDESSGHSRNNGAGFHVPGNDGPCRNNGIFTYGYAGQHDRAGTNPDIFADDYGGGVVAVAFVRQKAMIDGGKHNPVPYQDAVADADASLILKAAAGIDENIFPYGNILSKIGIKRRKEGKRGAH